MFKMKISAWLVLNESLGKRWLSLAHGKTIKGIIDNEKGDWNVKRNKAT